MRIESDDFADNDSFEFGSDEAFAAFEKKLLFDDAETDPDFIEDANMGYQLNMKQINKHLRGNLVYAPTKRN